MTSAYTARKRPMAALGNVPGVYPCDVSAVLIPIMPRIRPMIAIRVTNRRGRGGILCSKSLHRYWLAHRKFYSSGVNHDQLTLVSRFRHKPATGEQYQSVGTRIW